MRCVMKLKYTFLLLFLSLMNSVHVFVAEDVQVDMQDTQDMENQLIHAIDHNNKAKILEYIKQDPSLLFSLIDSDEFLENPDKAIHMFTIMKKAGVNFDYQDEDGDSILHAVVEAFIAIVFTMPLLGFVANKLALGLSRIFTGEENQEKDDASDYFLSEPDYIEVTKNAQKIVKGLLGLGIKKHLKNNDGQTAGDDLKSYINEIESDRGDYEKSFVELNKLYKMLK